MTALAALLIVTGTLCAAFGTLMFLALTANPDPISIRFAKRTATVGRWTASPGILLCLGHGGSHGTPMVTLLLVAALAAFASITTKTPIPTNPAAGNWPMGAQR